jgi:uncharacterized protein (TIGR02001 family)
MQHKNILLAALLALCHTAHAEEAATPPALTMTATYASDYIFRGMTQTWGSPAAQASIDYAHASGAFASLWASNISPKQYAGGHTEIDLSGGFRGAISDDIGYVLGAIHVFYPGANYNKISYASFDSQKYDFTEANAAISYKWLTAKLSYSLTDLLGFNAKTGYTGHSKGSTYFELNADIPLPQDFTAGLHFGHQHVKSKLTTPTAGGTTDPDFSDVRLSLSKRFGNDWNANLAWTRNLAGKFFAKTPSNYNLGETYDVNKSRVSVMLSKTF